ncbi:hypothetical protein SaccyDRAFT_0541 [Saccharomonospora cyanea NA-134]|uniref:WXG repeat protein n=1 Tax=Saccharomonospora cyanea NA-134 TaxID=882082 RepID=H5XGF0_9PSEU|nr:hypothetical protein SaccyDRAFT_0541 [Saccharomonospora cyanea NA-134]
MYPTPWEVQETKERANEEFTSDELDYMRSMLDDEDVSSEVKNNFLYALSNAGRLSEEEIDRYAPQVGADAQDVKWGGRDVDENMRNARTALGTARSENLDADVRRAYDGLGTGGFSTSDEIIDQTEVVIQWFEQFYSRYEAAQQVIETSVVPETERRELPTADVSAFTGGGDEFGTAEYTHSGIDPQSLRAGLDEFRGIDFAAFRADAEMLRSAGAAVADKAAALDSAWKGTDDWTGDAKAAAEQVNKTLSEGSETLQDALTTAADGIDEVTAIQEETVVRFSEELFRLYGSGKMGELTVADVDEALGTVHLASAMLDSWGGSFLAGIRDAYTEAQDQAKEVLSGFCQTYQSLAGQVHEQAAAHVEHINNNYGVIVQGLSQAIQTDPAADMDMGGDVQSPGPDMGGPGGAPGGGMPGGGVPGGGAPGGGAPGGGALGGGATVPSAEELLGEQPDTATNPVTGEPLEVDPATGEPYPIDPETGEAITDADGPGTLTVEQGDQKFTMTEPGEDGTMSITVEGGDGEPGEYRLDFGTESELGEAPGGDGVEEFGPQGSGGEAQQVYRPGPDGKIHVKDGDLEITAEQPEGPDGPTVVTVDNGKGDPVTYTLGADQEGQVLPAEEGVRVMPAHADPDLDPRRAAEPPTEASGGQGGGNPGSGPVDAASASTAGLPDASAGAAPSFDGNSDAPDEAFAGDDSGSSATHAAAVGGGGNAFGGGGGGGELFGEDSDGSGPSRSSGAGLGVAPGGEAPAAVAQGSGGAVSSGGGMGMMGGMGAMGGGAGGGQGGDQERSSNAYRIDGNIFEVSSGAIRVSGVLGESNEVPVRFSR